MNPQVWWYVSRSSGVVAWLMLTASVIWGVVLSTKAFPGRRRPAWLRDLHSWLGGLTVAFVAVHLAALVADSYVQFDLVDLLVPFASQWRPGAVALGVVAMWSVVAVQATSMAIRRLPRRLWRAVHLTSYLAFWTTSLHAALSGSDRATLLYQVTALASIVAVAWSMMYRVANRRSLAGAGSAGPGAATPDGTAIAADQTVAGDARGGSGSSRPSVAGRPSSRA